jgi:hypothetical protein
MSTVSVSVDLSALRNIGSAIKAETLPHLREAIGAIAAQGQKDWADAVSKAPGIWAEEKKQYISSIKWAFTGDFEARISAGYKYAQEIEDGRPPRDLKLMLNTSMKVRTVQSGKNAGKRYLIIPMQHNVPGSGALAPSMPDSVYQAAAQLAPSRVTGMGKRVSGTGAWSTSTRSPATVPQRKYAWGGRLETSHMKGLTSEQMRRYQGMVKFDTKGKGRVGHSTHLTFRVMMEGSSGWVVAAKPGQKFVPAVTARLQPLAEQVIAKAAQLDLSGGR